MAFSLDDFSDTISPDDSLPSHQVGTVTNANPLQVQWVHEDEDSGSEYPYLDSYHPVVGDTVLAIPHGQTWLVLSSVNGGSAVPVNPSKDAREPAQPTGLTITTHDYLAPNGETRVLASISWNAVTTTADDSAITDLAGYRVRWKYTDATGQPYTYIPDTDDSTLNVSIDALTPLETIEVDVAAVDLFRRISTYATATATLPNDTVAPNSPADPTVTNYLGVIQVKWSGLDHTGLAMPSDFDHVDVHIGTTPTFTPSAATKAGRLFAAGIFVKSDTVYGTIYYAKLQAFDKAGNASGFTSDSIGATASQIANPDYASLSINDAKISSLSVGKVTAGSLSAAVVLSGSIKTATTGNRVEIDAAGVRLYQGSTLTVDLNVAAGTGTFTGSIKSGSTITGAVISTSQTGGNDQHIEILTGTNRTLVSLVEDTSSTYPYLYSAIGSGSGSYAMRSGSIATNLNTGALVITPPSISADSLGNTFSPGGSLTFDVFGQPTFKAGTNTSALIIDGPLNVNGPSGITTFFWVDTSGSQPAVNAAGGMSVAGGFTVLTGGANVTGGLVVATGNINMQTGTLVSPNSTGVHIGGINCANYWHDTAGAAFYFNAHNVKCDFYFVTAQTTGKMIVSNNENIGYGCDTSGGFATVYVGGVVVGHFGSAGNYTATSTKRVKRAIKPHAISPNLVDNIKFSSYQMKLTKDQREELPNPDRRYHGVIAEDLAVDPELGIFTESHPDDGRMLGVHYDRLALAAAISTNEKVKLLEARIAELERAAK